MMPTPTGHRHRSDRGRRGFTLVELLLALAVTGLVAGALASMLFAARYGTSAENYLRTAVVQETIIRQRLNAAVRSARMVLAQGSTYVVLWAPERRAPGTPNLSELRRIELDPTNQRLLHYQAPAGLSAANDTAYPLDSTDFNAVTHSLKGSSDFPAEPWGSAVTGWTISLDSGDPQLARVVDYRLSLDAGKTAITAACSAALRSKAPAP